MKQGRREFLKKMGYVSAGSFMVPGLWNMTKDSEKDVDLFFKISLAQWSLHKAYFGGDLDPMNFPKITKEQYDIAAVEYVNQFYKDKGGDEKYWGKVKNIAENEGVYSHLIMCDGEGDLGDPDERKRTQAVDNHKKWVETIKFLGGRSIRVNARGQSGYSYDEQMKMAADGLRKLCEFSEPHKIYIIVENHGGISSNGQWMAELVQMVDHPLAGTLPDFGNFTIAPGNDYDRYKGTREMMPYAQGVSAKSYDFNEDGSETTIDYNKMMKIVKDAGFNGYMGIEYEGDRLGEADGIRATKKLLDQVGVK